MKQKILLFLIALIAAFNAHADYFSVGGINYSSNGDKVTVSSTLYSGDLVIPETVTYEGVTYTVTSIGEQAFAHCENLTSVTIPSSITSIQDNAFFKCTNLNSVTIDNASTAIGYQAFALCSNLTNVDFGNSVTSIEQGAFAYCYKLMDVEIPNTVTSIGKYAFNVCCSMTNLMIPSSVSFIDWEAFNECTSLTHITVDNNNSHYDSRNFCNALIETSTNTLIIGCSSTIIPNSVVTISDYAFSGCHGLTSVRIPNSVTSIGNWAFSNCEDLTDVTIGNSVTAISECAFHQCYNLKHVTIGNSVTTIGKFAFNNCHNLKILTIPNSVSTIGDCAFQSCDGLIGLTINSDLTLNESVFNGCDNLSNFTIGTAVTSIDVSSFRLGYNLKRVTSLATTPPRCSSGFPDEAYWNCTLYVPEESISAYESADYWRNFYNIYSFNEDNTAPWDVNFDIYGYLVDGFLYNLAFSDDDPMYAGIAMMHGRNFIWDPETDTYSEYQIQYDEWNTDSIFYVPDAIETEYGLFKLKFISGGFWGQNDIKTVHIPPTVNRIDAGFNNSSLESIIFDYNGANPIKFGEYADAPFQNCERLTTVEFERPIDIIPNFMFMNCPNLKNVYFYSDYMSLDTIGAGAFFNCSGLTHFDVPQSVKVIGGAAFCYCQNLESINLPDGLTTIDDFAFAECHQLDGIYLNPSLQSIGEGAFTNCWSLSSFSIPDHITTIKDFTFYDCRNLTDLNINNVTIFGDHSFAGCDKLSSIDLTKAQSIGEAAFFSGKVLCGVSKDPDNDPPYVRISYREENWYPGNNEGSFNKIILGENVSVMNDRTFYGHIPDTIICMAPTPPTFSNTNNTDWVFSLEAYDSTVLCVPQVLVNDYREAYGWSRFAHIEGIGVVEPGDIDGDGVMNVKDVTDLIDMLLAGTINIEDNPAADVNGDGSINVADVTGLIDMLLSSN